MRQALAGMLWSKQYFHYDLATWLEEHRRPPRDAVLAATAGAQRRVVPHAQRRHHLDAGQVGVPLVRGLGPGVPRAAAGDGGPRLRQVAAGPHAAQRLPAPQRPDAGVRVELRRREPAGPRLRHHAGLPPGQGAERRQGRHRLPGLRLLQAPGELHLVGEPQGPHREQRLRGRLPRAGQHRRLRPQLAAAHRRLPRAGRRHGLDGLLQPADAPHRGGAGAAQPGLRGVRHQVLRAHHLDLRSHGPGGREPRRHVGRGGRLLLRRAPAPGRPGDAAQGALDGGAPAAGRGGDLRREHPRPAAHLRPNRPGLPASPPRALGQPPHARPAGRRGHGG